MSDSLRGRQPLKFSSPRMYVVEVSTIGPWNSAEREREGEGGREKGREGGREGKREGKREGGREGANRMNKLPLSISRYPQLTVCLLDGFPQSQLVDAHTSVAVATERM